MVDTQEKVLSYLDASTKDATSGRIIKSPYAAVLQEARGMTGRDIYSGEKIPNVSHGSWLGTVGYIIAIDHIGDKFFCPKMSTGLMRSVNLKIKKKIKLVLL